MIRTNIEYLDSIIIMTTGTLAHSSHPKPDVLTLLRYANASLPDRKVIPYLSDLVQTYFTTMNAIGAETWIMHGTLLAWWWNQKVG
jgi:hypothetical protein